MVDRMPNEHRTVIEVSHRTILLFFLLLVLLYVFWQISWIIVGLFIAYLIMTAVNPITLLLEKVKIPRELSAVVILFAVLVLLASGIAALIPPVVEQTGSFLSQLPHLLKQLGVELDQNLISSQLGSIPQNAFRVISGAFSNVLAVFTVLVISYHLIIERPHLPRVLHWMFGDGEPTAEELLSKVETHLGAWIRGQVALSLIIGIAVYLGLISMTIPYAVPLAIIAGVLEVIPNIGPTVSMIPAAIVGFTISPLHGGAVILLYFLIQQLENNLIVPFVMKKAVGLNPLVTIVSLMIGFKLGGALGAILAIPIVVAGRVTVPFFFSRAKGKLL